MALNVPPPPYTSSFSHAEANQQQPPCTSSFSHGEANQQQQPPAYVPGSVASSQKAPEKAHLATAAAEQVRYIQVGASSYCTYMVRSDGVVDRTTGRGKVHQQMVPPPGTGKYVFAAADQCASYLLTDNGTIVRTTSGGKTSIASIINPPPGQAYVKVSAGPIASYFILSDGAVMRSVYGGAIDRVIPAPLQGVKYVDASAGMAFSYLLRDDGLIDRVRGGQRHCDAGSSAGAARNQVRRRRAAVDGATRQIQQQSVCKLLAPVGRHR